MGACGPRDHEWQHAATKALGYALKQEPELRRILDNADLPLDNTRAERALRKILVGRKNWLFYGSDAHAEAAAANFSLIASCRLHRLDPFAYLEEVLRTLPCWPRDRYLELAPARWAATRAQLNPDELEMPLGSFTAPALAIRESVGGLASPHRFTQGGYAASISSLHAVSGDDDDGGPGHRRAGQRSSTQIARSRSKARSPSVANRFAVADSSDARSHHHARD